ncbi:MAG: 5-methyltetrahydropteroyltriglutamate--homocysteine methyltransferase [Alphaproteobacteria bacterium]|nr:5-methyltetrahydropteroyltriglutamate--homocysteine methyltransferase [Alphaproteobacteria bacterium]
MQTTTIGSYPKPDSMTLPGFIAKHPNPTARYTEWLATRTDADKEAALEGARTIVREQASCGIDIPTDGEAPREHYVYYHLRHIEGFDFENLAERESRGGAWSPRVPVLRHAVQPGFPFLVKDWRTAQEATGNPVKMTVPGPMTIIDSTVNEHYSDERALARALADTLNVEIRRLAEAGCRFIQVDEPLFARRPDAALDWGIECLERCFHGLPPTLTRVMHMCCGYPSALNMTDYPKADPQAYFELAGPLDMAKIDAVSIEDAHRHNDLALLEKFTQTTVILGCVDIANTRVETVDEISGRLGAAHQHIDPARLIAAPDCGLAMLDRDTAVQKMSNLASAAHAID